MKQIYSPSSDRKMRIGVLFSGSASSLEYLLGNDPNCNVTYQFVGALTNNRNAAGMDLVSKNSIELAVLDYGDFIAARDAGFRDSTTREAYFKEVANLLQKWNLDILMFSGFMLIAPSSFLNQFQNQILNVHPADLTILNDFGNRKYAGLNVVEKAIKAGDSSTRSSVHLVTEGVDEGQIIALSVPLEIDPARSASEHQEFMKIACDGPAYQQALNLIAEGKVWINDDSFEILIEE
jgi:phosphoribosylglycinamide formyltransferase-1